MFLSDYITRFSGFYKKFNNEFPDVILNEYRYDFIMGKINLNLIELSDLMYVAFDGFSNNTNDGDNTKIDNKRLKLLEEKVSENSTLIANARNIHNRNQDAISVFNNELKSRFK